jgi:hypothetical protein
MRLAPGAWSHDKPCALRCYPNVMCQHQHGDRIGAHSHARQVDLCSLVQMPTFILPTVLAHLVMYHCLLPSLYPWSGYKKSISVLTHDSSVSFLATLSHSLQFTWCCLYRTLPQASPLPRSGCCLSSSHFWWLVLILGEQYSTRKPCAGSTTTECSHKLGRV